MGRPSSIDGEDDRNTLLERIAFLESINHESNMRTLRAYCYNDELELKLDQLKLNLQKCKELLTSCITYSGTPMLRSYYLEQEIEQFLRGESDGASSRAC